MRIAAFIVIAAGLAVAASPASAQTYKKKKRVAENREHYSITVRKYRNFLDAGTEVRPGEKGYHDYVSLLNPRYPSYGPAGPDNREFRYPLPGPYDWTPY